MKQLTILAILLAAPQFQADAATQFVTQSGAGTMDGSTWSNARPGTGLQAAIAASGAGDQVWVAAGTYKPTTVATRTIYFNMKTGVEIYGSFAGTETTLAQRNISCGPTSILSGEIGGGGTADNSYHVISNTNVGATALLDGFVISDGNANFDMTGNDNRSLGGGMLNAGQSSGLASPTVRNCVFTNNSALFGGGIFNHGQNGGNASPTVLNCIFFANFATSGGAGMDNFGYNGNASPVLLNCIFAANAATQRAGGMYCWGGGNGNASPVILNCSFVGNSAVDGGGIVADRSNFTSGNSGTASPNIRNTIFWGNTASGTGPQFFIIGGAVFAPTYSDIDLTGQAPPHIITGPGTGNLNSDPLFIAISDFDGPDGCWMTNDDGLHVGGGSPCTNAGNNPGTSTADLKFYERIADGTVDMGVYEENSIPLPIELTRFFGKAGNGHNLLFWATATERGNRSFEIERGADGILFEKIGEVAGAGDSNTPVEYRFSDERPEGAAHFYRLKMADLDGGFVHGPVVFLENRTLGDGLAFQNPVSDVLLVRAAGGEIDGGHFVLLNQMGERVLSVFADGPVFSLDMGELPGGAYFLKNERSAVFYKVVKVGN